MADRTVNVGVNLQSGEDTLSPALEKQRKKAEELQRQIDKIRGVDPDPEGAAEKKLARLEQQLKSLNREMAAGAATPGVGQFSGAEVHGAAGRYREQQRQALLRAVGQAQVTGVIPANQITAVGGGQGGAMGVLGGLAQRAAMTAASAVPGAGAAAGVLGALPGALGVLGLAAGATAGVIGMLDAAFTKFRPSVTTLIDELQRAEGITSRVRQTGLPTARDVRRALNEDEQRRYQEAEDRGDVAGQRQILAGANARAQQQATALGGQNLGQMQTQVEGALEEIRVERETFGTSRPAVLAEIQGRLNAMFESRGMAIPGQIHGASTSATPITRNEVRTWAEGATVGAVHAATANVESTAAAIRSGMPPSLRPGALNLSDLPNLFQSRQMDVLETHAQIQQDLVRDMRQQQQFEQQMGLWERIYARLGVIASGLGQPGVMGNPAGGVGGGIGVGFGAPWVGDGGFGGGAVGGTVGAAAAP